jgi:hypothetical protein
MCFWWQLYTTAFQVIKLRSVFTLVCLCISYIWNVRWRHVLLVTYTFRTGIRRPSPRDVSVMDGHRLHFDMHQRTERFRGWKYCRADMYTSNRSVASVPLHPTPPPLLTALSSEISRGFFYTTMARKSVIWNGYHFGDNSYYNPWPHPFTPQHRLFARIVTHHRNVIYFQYR